MGRQSCDDCRETYRRRNTPSRWDKKPIVKKDPPCSTCKPTLHPWNLDAVSAYSRCSGQWILSSGGSLVALRMEAVAAIVKEMGIPKKDRLTVIDDVRTISERVAKLVNADRAEKRERERNQDK